MTDTTTRDLLDALHQSRAPLTAAEGDALGNYMLGALSARLEGMPGGPEAWVDALDTARECVTEAAERRAAREAVAL